jgi:hypothetical protein
MRHLLLTSIALVASAALISCTTSSENATGTANSGGTDTAGVTTAVQYETLAAVPNASGDVATDTGTGNISAKTTAKADPSTTGLKLGTTTSSSFSSSTNEAACHIFNMFKTAEASLTAADTIACYLSHIIDGAKDAGVKDTSGETLALANDATTAYIMSVGSDVIEDGAPGHVKFSVTKDSSGDITNFELFACSAAKSAGGAQTDYVKKTVSNTAFSAEMLHKGSESDSAEADLLVASGTLITSGDNKGKFSTKSVTMKRVITNSSDTVTEWEHIKFTENPTNGILELNLFITTEQGSQTGKMYTQFDILDHNTAGTTYSPANLAMGDGTAQMQFGSEAGTTTSWNADTIAVDTNGNDYTASVTAATLPSNTQPTVDFTGSQVYACDGTPTIALTAAAFANTAAKALDVDTPCATPLSLDHSFINCAQGNQPTSSLTGAWSDNGSTCPNGTAAMTVMVDDDDADTYFVKITGNNNIVAKITFSGETCTAYGCTDPTDGSTCTNACNSCAIDSSATPATMAATCPEQGDGTCDIKGTKDSD